MRKAESLGCSTSPLCTEPVSSFEITGSKELFRGDLVGIDELEITNDGQVFTREIVRHPGAVAVIPVDSDGTVVLIRQYRAAAGTLLLEVTAGTCDVAGEDLDGTASRELAEEVGIAADSLELLGMVMNSPGYCDQRTAVFLATGLTSVARRPAGPEELASEVVRLPLVDAVAMVDSGDISDLTTCFAITMAARRHGV